MPRYSSPYVIAQTMSLHSVSHGALVASMRNASASSRWMPARVGNAGGGGRNSRASNSRARRLTASALASTRTLIPSASARWPPHSTPTPNRAASTAESHGPTRGYRTPAVNTPAAGRATHAIAVSAPSKRRPSRRRTAMPSNAPKPKGTTTSAMQVSSVPVPADPSPFGTGDPIERDIGDPRPLRPIGQSVKHGVRVARALLDRNKLELPLQLIALRVEARAHIARRRAATRDA